MRLLLDTHVALWALMDPGRIGADGLAMIADGNNTIYVSVVSIWEIAIKRALGRKSAPPFSSVEAVRFFEASGYLTLDLTAAHVTATERLPLLHQDPFDRLLVAQATVDSLGLMTHDAAIVAYGTNILKV